MIKFGKALLEGNLSQTTVERCLLQTLRVDYMHTSHETLTLTSAWWPPWDQGRDWRHVSLIINLEGQCCF